MMTQTIKTTCLPITVNERRSVKIYAASPGRHRYDDKDACVWAVDEPGYIVAPFPIPVYFLRNVFVHGYQVRTGDSSRGN